MRKQEILFWEILVSLGSYKVKEFVFDVNWFIYFWQLIRNRYPSKDMLLFDDVLGIYALTHVSYIMVDSMWILLLGIYLCTKIHIFSWFSATFVLHHPEHGHAVVLPIISCIIDGILVYDKTSPPFASFISLVCPESEVESLSWNF